MSEFTTNTAATTVANTAGTTATTTTKDKFTADDAKSWLGLGTDVLGLGKSIWSIFSGNDYSDQEKNYQMQMQLSSYQATQQKKTTTIIIIAGAITIVAVIITLLLTRKK